MGISRSMPLFSAAAFSPLVRQLGPSESTTIFWNYGNHVRRGRLRDWFSYLRSDDGELTPRVEFPAASLGLTAPLPGR